MRTRRKIKRCWLKQQQKNPGGGALQMEETASAKALSQGFSRHPRSLIQRMQDKEEGWG